MASKLRFDVDEAETEEDFAKLLQLCIENNTFPSLFKLLVSAMDDNALSRGSEIVAGVLVCFTRTAAGCAALLDSGLVETVCELLASPHQESAKALLLGSLAKITRTNAATGARLATPATLAKLTARLRRNIDESARIEESRAITDVLSALVLSPDAPALSDDARDDIVAALRAALAAAVPSANLAHEAFKLSQTALRVLSQILRKNQARYAADIEAVALSPALEFALGLCTSVDAARADMLHLLAAAAALPAADTVERVFTAERLTQLRKLKELGALADPEHDQLYAALVERLASVSPTLADGVSGRR